MAKLSVRTDIRHLVHLYNVFKELPDVNSKSNNAMDMFNRVNYHLSDAITQYTTREDGKIKPGLELTLMYIINSAALILKGTILTQDLMPGAFSEKKHQEALAAANEIDLFLSIFNLMQIFVFDNATYMLNKNHPITLRKPSSLPREEDVSLLQNYVVT